MIDGPLVHLWSRLLSYHSYRRVSLVNTGDTNINAPCRACRACRHRFEEDIPRTTSNCEALVRS